MTDNELLRYSRHILLDEIGIDGQEKLRAAHALVIGAGGLGSPVALYLGSGGVGRITLVDHDTVDLTNLQRQIAHNMDRIGLSKAQSAQQAISAINPQVRVEALPVLADAPLLEERVPTADVVIDCCDDFATRHLVNAACFRHGKPLVSGAAIRFDGQVAVYDPRDTASPCYACVFPAREDSDESRCSTLGIFAPLVGIIGAMQAAEAIKLLSGAGTSLAGRLQMLDARAMHWSEIRTPRMARCPVCGQRPEAGLSSG